MKLSLSWHRQNTPSSRSLLIDLARIFACLAVLTFHWRYDAENGIPGIDVPLIYNWGNFGLLGVDIFFILSGAVIAKTALDRDFKSFLIARFLRIQPCLMLCSFFTIPVLLVENGQNFNHAKWIVFEGIKNATGFPLVTAIQGGNDTYFIGDEWTLSVEILFYFLMATLIFTCGKLDYIQLGYIAAFAQLGIEFFGNHISASYASYFLFGILLFCVRSPKDFLVMGIPIFVGGYDVYERVLNKIQNHIVDTHADQANLISLLFVLCIMFVIIFRDTISSKNDKWVNLIQTLSLMTFPIYLLHETLGRALAGILFSIGGPVILDYGLSFVVVLLMSYFSVKMFEPQVRTLYLKAIKKYF